jgi:hypothetical protein
MQFDFTQRKLIETIGLQFKVQKFAGWEGRFTPAQGSESFMLRIYLFIVDRMRTLSGGKPPFPTCEFPNVDSHLDS